MTKTISGKTAKTFKAFMTERAEFFDDLVVASDTIRTQNQMLKWVNNRFPDQPSVHETASLRLWDDYQDWKGGKK